MSYDATLKTFYGKPTKKIYQFLSINYAQRERHSKLTTVVSMDGPTS